MQLIAACDDLEEQIGITRVVGEIPDLVMHMMLCVV